jgi:cysteinylglycine-S-conjugate dipeptidase
MTHKKIDRDARRLIEPDNEFVAWHVDYLARMVAVDSRSFGVAEFEGDRKTPSDMKEILALAEDYLRQIGFTSIRINQNSSGPTHPFPLLLAQGPLDPEKPTILFYAHLDKQPYMDDGNFMKWDGVPPTQLTWNADRTRAYGRGAADDLSGVISIGMSVHALLKTLEAEGNEDPFSKIPCNIKVMYETEEECGSHSLSLQIKQNPDFFKEIDCVIITDVVNPATGVPGLTASLRGILQSEIELKKVGPLNAEDPQTVLYKILASLIHDDHSLAVDAIAQADTPLTAEEEDGLRQVPMTVDALRDMAGILPATAMTVPNNKEMVLALSWVRQAFVSNSKAPVLSKTWSRI